MSRNELHLHKTVPVPDFAKNRVFERNKAIFTGIFPYVDELRSVSSFDLSAIRLGFRLTEKPFNYDSRMELRDGRAFHEAVTLLVQRYVEDCISYPNDTDESRFKRCKSIFYPLYSAETSGPSTIAYTLIETLTTWYKKQDEDMGFNKSMNDIAQVVFCGTTVQLNEKYTKATTDLGIQEKALTFNELIDMPMRDKYCTASSQLFYEFERWLIEHIGYLMSYDLNKHQINIGMLPFSILGLWDIFSKLKNLKKRQPNHNASELRHEFIHFFAHMCAIKRGQSLLVNQ